MAVTKIHGKLSGDLNVQKRGPANYVFLFLHKYILVTKKGICRNDKFDLFFLGVQQRDFDGQRRLRKRYLKSEFALPQTFLALMPSSLI